MFRHLEVVFSNEPPEVAVCITFLSCRQHFSLVCGLSYVHLAFFGQKRILWEKYLHKIFRLWTWKQQKICTSISRFVDLWFGSRLDELWQHTVFVLYNPKEDVLGWVFLGVIYCLKPLPTSVWGSAHLKGWRVESGSTARAFSMQQAWHNIRRTLDALRSHRLSMHPVGLWCGCWMESGAGNIFCAEAQCKWLGRIRAVYLGDGWTAGFVYLWKPVSLCHMLAGI